MYVLLSEVGRKFACLLNEHGVINMSLQYFLTGVFENVHADSEIGHLCLDIGQRLTYWPLPVYYSEL